MSESPGPLVPAAARHPWLCLWGGAMASFLSVGGRFDVPLAVWAAPLLLLRFLRHTRPLVALPAVFAVTVSSAAVWMAELAVPITWLTLLGDVAFGVAYGLPYVADRLLGPSAGTLGRYLVRRRSHPWLAHPVLPHGRPHLLGRTRRHRGRGDGSHRALAAPPRSADSFRLLRAGVRRWPGQVTDTARTMTRTPYGGDPGSGPGPRTAAWPPHTARPVHRTPCHAVDLRE
ncbi:hypothetical protein [Streptomyces sp. 11-1-2]|uniref:hypothetical protein n=1 Tax=unclassified Streptomyces TaxID=2593676 RepID=UPI000B8D40BC|nr:hypothetical protein [Streptomyces sp. 11-1-2]ASQ92349.1 hypothetical protein CGL27_03530 [Streptomyces sp. 11-1-2]